MGVVNKEGALYFATGIDNTGMRKDADETLRIVDSITSGVKKAGIAMGAVFGATSLVGFGNEIVKVRGEIQMLESSFETLLGSRAKADKMIAEIKEFAVESPLSLTGVSNAAQTLLSFNIEAEKTIPIIRQIGDISMGNEQRFQSLILAFSQMSSIGKLMGQDLNQMINAGFNPLQEISRTTGKSISELRAEMEGGAISAKMVEDAFESATAQGGKFYEMTKKQAEGIQGLKAQLDGSIQEMFNEIGKDSEKLVAGVYKSSKSVVESYETIGRVIASLIATYGTYKAAVVAATVAETGWTISQMARYKWLLLVEKATGLLNATMAKNPYVLVATLIVGLVSAVWALRDRTTAAEKAQKAFNETMEEAAGRKEAFKVRSDELISTLKNETATIYQQVDAYKQLMQMMPDELKGKSFNEVQQMSASEIQSMRNKKADEDHKSEIKRKYEEQLANIEGFRKKIKELSDKDERQAGPELSYYRKQLQIGLLQAESLKKTLEDISDTEEKAGFLSLSKENQRKRLEEQKVALERHRDELERLYGNNPVTMSIETADMFAKVNNEINELDKTIESYSERAITKNKAYWEQVKKTAEDTRAGLGTDEHGGEQWSILTKQITEANKELEKYSDKAAKAGDGNDKLQRQADLNSRLAEQDRQRFNAAKRMEHELLQLEIERKEDGFDKALQTIELAKKMELQSIEERKEAEIKANQEIERTKWELAGKGGVFTPSAGLTAEQQELYDRLTKESNEKERASKGKLLEDLLKDYRTHEQQRTEIAKKYDQVRTLLASENIDGRFDKNIEELNKKENAELAAFDNQIQSKTSILSRMFADMSDKSIEELKLIRREAESLWAFLSGGEWDSAKGAIFGITKEQFDDIVGDPDKLVKFKKGVDEIKQSITSLETPIGLAREGFEELFNPDHAGTNKRLESLGKIKKGLEGVADAAKRAGELIDSIYSISGKDSGIGGDISRLADIGGDIAGTIVSAMTGDIAGTIAGYASYMSKIFTWIGDNKKHREELKKQVKESQQQEYFGQLEIEQLWRQKYEWAQKIGESTLNYLKREGEELKKQTNDNAKAQEDLWKQLTQQQYKSGEYFKKTGLFGWGKGKIVEEWSSLAGKTWEDIEKLAAQGKLSEEGLKFYEALKKAKEEGVDLAQMQGDYLEKLNETYTGSAYESVVSGIVQAFKNGKRSAADFAKSFENLMKNAVESSLNLLANEQMRKWYEEFAEAGKDGYTKDEIEKAKKDWISLNEKLAEQAKQLEEVTGIKIGQATGGVPGELKKEMTEGTASQLVGLWNMTAMDIRAIKEFFEKNGTPDIAKEISVLLNELQEIKQNTGRTASNTDYLENGLRNVEDKLEEIRKNTKANTSRV